MFTSAVIYSVNRERPAYDMPEGVRNLGQSFLWRGGYFTNQYCPHMVKGCKHQKVSCEQWTVKGFKIVIVYRI